MIKVGINGFGRIGRQAFKVWFEKHRQEMEIVAVNDLTDANVLAHLLKYDSVYGIWNHKVEGTEGSEGAEGTEGKQVGMLKVEDVEVKVFATKEPEKLPWKDLGIDVVIESTGRFTKKEDAGKHIAAGGKKKMVFSPGQKKTTFLFFSIFRFVSLLSPLPLLTLPYLLLFDSRLHKPNRISEDGQGRLHR